MTKIITSLFSHSVLSDFLQLTDCSPQASQSLTISQSLPRFMSIALVVPSSRLILRHTLLLLPLVFSSIRDFLNPQDNNAKIITKKLLKKLRFFFCSFFFVLRVYDIEDIQSNNLEQFLSLWLWPKHESGLGLFTLFCFHFQIFFILIFKSCVNYLHDQKVKSTK